jgi:phosphoesterase RecJ-like protein
MVADLIDALGIAWTPDIATHLYLAIATDTGGRHRRPMSPDVRNLPPDRGRGPRTRSALASDLRQLQHRAPQADRRAPEWDGALPWPSPRDAYSTTTCRLLRGDAGRPAERESAARGRTSCGGAVQAAGDSTFRVSLRSKGAVDVRLVAQQWDGGGHTNASGCAIPGP